jgi:hypothetical protein
MTSRYGYAWLIMMVALCFSPSAFAQDSRGTAAQQAACTPDAFRLCSNYIPDPTDVANCLRQRRSELSGPCRSVFEQAEPRPSTRRSSRE